MRANDPSIRRPIAANQVAFHLILVHDEATRLYLRTQPPSASRVCPGWLPTQSTVRVLAIDRHQIFGTGEDEDVRIVDVRVSRKTLSVLRVTEGSDAPKPKPNGPLPAPES